MKNIIYLLLIAVLCSLNTQAFSQCKYETNETDPFTGKIKKVTKTQKLIFPSGIEKMIPGNIWKCFIYFNRNDTSSHINIVYVFLGEQNIFMDTNDFISFKLQNGEIIKLNLNNKFAPTSYLGVGGVNTDYNVQCNISKILLTKLSNSPIVYFQYSINKEQKSVEIKPKFAEEIMKDASCILN
jgi:hypothetical protein